jgi:folate-binding protein YgfZ
MPDDQPTPASGGTWYVPPADFAAVLRGAVCTELSELGVIEVSGADAVTFLHSQLINDVAHQDESEVRHNGYCTPKGRLLATCDVWRQGELVYLQLPREILAGVLKRLSLFVLRAKARLTDVADEWTTFAVLGAGAGTALDAQALAADRSITADAARITRLPAAPPVAERYLLRCPRSAAAAWRDRLALPPVAAGVWWWTQIDAGLPTVFAVTQEQFVPQMINYEVIGGVSFKKGCYPGQEIVARSQYLGKLRRRMSLARVETAAAQAGADVYAAGEPQPVGRVVMAAAAPHGGMEVLFEAPVERVDNTRLLLGGPDGVPLQVRALPYPLIDVTA